MAACGSPVDFDEDVIVPDGKEDNFYSASASEYWVTGTAKVTLEAELAGKPAEERLARAKALVPLKNLQIGWFLNQWLAPKKSDDANANYGGFESLVRFDSEETEALVEVDELTYTYGYKVQVGGSPRLISKTGKTFTLQMAKVANDVLDDLVFNKEWYRSAPYESWDPTDVAAENLEPIDLAIEKQTASKDSFIPYDRLFADGELTIGVHYGWDYHSRYDISNSRDWYNELVSDGFKSPVDKYEDYLRTSGPLTKTIKWNGKDVVVKVSIFHPGNAADNVPGPDPDTDEGGKILEDDMRESFKSFDVIVFKGHSGPAYGFALANWRKTEAGDVDDSKVPGLVMPSDKYQLVLANGCETYDLGGAFWKNPNKADKKNLNVITTTNPSSASTNAQLTTLLTALTNQTNGNVRPWKISEVVEKFDAANWGFNTMYGVHGTDANPKYDPMRELSSLCAPCVSDTAGACGNNSNRCTRLTTGTRVCTYECIDQSGCPTGFSCRAVASKGNKKIKSKQCVPTLGICL